MMDRIQFIHDDPQFAELVHIVADRQRLTEGIVEKDYWVWIRTAKMDIAVAPAAASYSLCPQSGRES